MSRLQYLEEIAAYTGTAYKSHLKKEAGYWIDQILSELSPGGSEHEWRFVVRYNNKSQVTYFKYNVKHCHVNFNNSLPPDYNTFYILSKIFLLSEGDIHTILRPKFKKYFKKLGVPAEKKIKFFFNKNL